MSISSSEKAYRYLAKTFTDKELTTELKTLSTRVSSEFASPLIAERLSPDKAAAIVVEECENRNLFDNSL